MSACKQSSKTKIDPKAQRREIQKAFRDYDKAEHAMTNLRDELYPVGTKVRSRALDVVLTVKGGSLYPDQVNTEWGHMSWWNLEKVE